MSAHPLAVAGGGGVVARVFVSHAGADLRLASEVHDWLVEAGHEVFLDRDPQDGIPVGEPWEQQLYERLRWADAVVCVVTSAYLASPWCTAEVGAAHARGSRLLPLRAEVGVVHPLLASTQHTDYAAHPVKARNALVEALRRVGLGWPQDRSPFPGLRPFEADRHRVFFGRAEEVRQLAEFLRSPAEHAEGTALLVVGPSGCGKSSLVRAGLLPVLADEPGWRALPPILPGADPMTVLARELAAAARRVGLDWTIEHVRHQLDQRGLTGLVDELLLVDPVGPQQRMLIVIDQFEELLTQTPPAQRTRFAELLRPALAGPVRVVATLRPEFLDQLLLDPDLAAFCTRPYTLRPLRREALRAVIEQPAQLAGIEVDDGLVDRLVEDTDTGEALPLLAFTLAQLAEGVTRGGRLSSARYDQLGGVHGALTRQADAALTDAIAAGGRSREQVIAGLLRLVTVDEQGRPTRWRVTRTELPDHVVTELNTFITRRLLTTDTGNATVVIGVAHEAFLSAWPPLAQAIAQNVSALRARRAVEQAASEWDDNRRPPARLWSSGQLATAVADTGARFHAGTTPASAAPRPRSARWFPQRHRVLVTDRVDLSAKARDFLHASIRRDRSRSRRAITVLSVLLIVSLAAASIAINQQRRAEGERHNAEDRQLVATSRQLLAQAELARDTDLNTALRLGLAAHRIHPDGQTHASLINTLTSTHYAHTLTGYDNGADLVAFAPDGRILATGTGEDTDDPRVILWDLTNPAQPRRLDPSLTGHTGRVNSVAFTPDGRTLATGGRDGGVILWDLTNPTQPRRLTPLLTGHTDPVLSMALAPDGRTLTTAGGDGLMILWDLTNPAQPGRLTLPGHIDSQYWAEFAPDGHTLATDSADGTLILWDLTNPAQPRRLAVSGHTGGVSSVAFTPDGHTLATASQNGTVILWDLTDPTQPRRLTPPLTGHTNIVYSVVFAPDGHTLATASLDNTVILWDITSPVQPRRLGPPLTDHTDSVNKVAFSPDRRTLATGSSDRTVILWDITSPVQPRRLGPPLTGHTDWVSSVAFAPDGNTLATASANDAMVILWDLTNPAQPRRLGPALTGHDYLVLSVAFAPDGHTLATAGGFFDDTTVILWDITNPAQPRRLAPPLTGAIGGVSSMAFTPDGHTLATGSGGGAVILWDITNPTQPRRLDPPLIDHAEASSVALALDGHILATAGSGDGGPYDDDGVVMLWDITNPTQPRRLTPPLTGYTDTVHSMAFAPDGHTLATVSGRTVILWDITNPTQPGRLGPPLADHTEGVSSVAFAPNGHTLATASGDRTVILWNFGELDYLLEDDHAVKRACSLARGGLDQDEWGRHIPDLPYQDTCPA